MIQLGPVASSSCSWEVVLARWLILPSRHLKVLDSHPDQALKGAKADFAFSSVCARVIPPVAPAAPKHLRGSLCIESLLSFHLVSSRLTLSPPTFSFSTAPCSFLAAYKPSR